MKYAVIKKETIYTPGDERSRTHPGHGYPESWDTIENLQKFKTEEELKAWIERNPNKDYVAIAYQELEITTKINVNLKPKE